MRIMRLIGDAKRQMKWAGQRVVRGWDDRALWSLDYYLASNLVTWLSELKRTKVGVPCSCLVAGPETEENMLIAVENWNTILDTMIDGFQAAADMAYGEGFDDGRRERFRVGMQAFAEYFFDLWD